MDLALNVNGGKPIIYFNRLPREERNWLAIDLEGSKSNRNGIGAALELQLEDKTLYRYVTAGSGFSAQNQLTTYFGLSDRTRVKGLVIRWPSGHVDTYEGDTFAEKLGVNRRIFIREGEKQFQTSDPLPDSSL